ncbi:MAG: efflux RND transporter periplasmic adaptor subunit [Candidatus Solibacter sp.]|nr:efflux RND transporter periplasmic adaptor subunit [Candidatus Solibacter sp.]
MNQKPLLLIPLLLLVSCSKKETAEAEAPAPVQVTAVTQDTIRRTVAGDGMLFPRDQAGVTAKIAAPVQRFLVQRGDHVKQGQLLAVLESRDLAAGESESQALLAQTEANLRATTSAQIPESIVKAQTDVDTAKQTEDAAKKLLDNREKLFQQGALARKLVDDAQVAYAQAHGALLSAQEHLRALQSVGKQEQLKTAASQVDAARSHLQSSQVQVSYSQIVSPISGVVADRPLYAGEMATPGAPLVTVMDISRVIARANVPQNQSASVRVGQPATITQVDTNHTVEGKVTVVSPATDPNSTTLQVWVQAENPGEQLKPGTSVHVTIMTEVIKAATVIPVAAVLPGEEGGTACLVITADHIAHRRSVKLGVREGDKVQILNGVRPGEEVVIVGGIGLDDKAKVKIIDLTVKEAPDEDENAPEETPVKDQKKGEAKPKSK